MLTSGKNCPSSIPMTSNSFQSSPSSLKCLQALAFLNCLYNQFKKWILVLLVMSCNAFYWVTRIFSILYIETFLTRDLMAGDSSYQFSALSSEHRSNNKLNSSSLSYVTQSIIRLEKAFYGRGFKCRSWSCVILWGLVVHTVDFERVQVYWIK